jgi:hypothetical protein
MLAIVAKESALAAGRATNHQRQSAAHAGLLSNLDWSTTFGAAKTIRGVHLAAPRANPCIGVHQLIAVFARLLIANHDLILRYGPSPNDPLSIADNNCAANYNKFP